MILRSNILCDCCTSTNENFRKSIEQSTIFSSVHNCRNSFWMNYSVGFLGRDAKQWACILFRHDPSFFSVK